MPHTREKCKFFTDEDGEVHPIRSTCTKKKKTKAPVGSLPSDQITRRVVRRRSPSPPRPRSPSPSPPRPMSPPPSPIRRPNPSSVSTRYYPGFKSRVTGDTSESLGKIRGRGKLQKTSSLLAEANKLMERDYKGKKTFLKAKRPSKYRR